MDQQPEKEPAQQGRNLTPPTVDVTDQVQRTAPDSELRNHGIYFFGEKGSPYQEEVNKQR
ncbi:MAG: hypothetical protein JWN15_1798 [Firmicutes bacterium]|nr:hypothetical protein [Bacillota bacterium]